MRAWIPWFTTGTEGGVVLIFGFRFLLLEISVALAVEVSWFLHLLPTVLFRIYGFVLSHIMLLPAVPLLVGDAGFIYFMSDLKNFYCLG